MKHKRVTDRHELTLDFKKLIRMVVLMKPLTSKIDQNVCLDETSDEFELGVTLGNKLGHGSPGIVN